jgi:type II secretory pathway pseudopilin PulG
MRRETVFALVIGLMAVIGLTGAGNRPQKAQASKEQQGAMLAKEQAEQDADATTAASQEQPGTPAAAQEHGGKEHAGAASN